MREEGRQVSARILVLDLERVPAFTKPLPVWDMKGLMNRRLGPDDIQSWGRTICFAYRWGLRGPIEFAAEWQEGGREGYLRTAQRLMEEADVLSGHNSELFDHRHLAGDLFAELDVKIPRIKHIDTLKLARANANYENNQLVSLTDRFGIPSKTDKYRIAVAMAAVGGDEKMQRKIERYNRGDVRASTGMLKKYLPLSGVNLGLFVDDPTRPVCPRCESKKVQRRGTAVKAALRYPRYQCQACGGWSTGKKALPGGSVEMRPL
jgi:hypothetical protein